jgi:fructose-bisphosphate aldolase class I
MAEVGGSYQSFLTKQQEAELNKVAVKLVTPGKGILAVDETTDNIGQKLSALNLENTEKNRQKYRQLLFTTPNLGEHISGVILFEETFDQTTDKGEKFVDVLKKQGISPGVKVDTGLVPLAGTLGETTTQGLDDLAKRCAVFKKGGAEFVKFRCAIHIGPNTPSHLALLENANVLARYASISQQSGLVPVVEPDVVRDGDHDLARCQKVTEQALAYTYKALSDHHVFLEGTVLKTNHVAPGQAYTGKVTPEEVGLATVVTLRRTVPAAVPGVAFLSGGLSELEATQYLNAVNQVNLLKPWRLSFSYGRAMQATVLKEWQGKDANASKAQKKLLLRAQANGTASLGKYTGEDASAAAAESLFVANHNY